MHYFMIDMLNLTDEVKCLNASAAPAGCGAGNQLET